jgi:hypothetical protein
MQDRSWHLTYLLPLGGRKQKGILPPLISSPLMEEKTGGDEKDRARNKSEHFKTG